MRSSRVASTGYLAFLVLFLLIALVSPAFAQAEGKPNIIFILADDLGWKDVGFHGCDIRTPNLDRLAETGAVLEQFYAEPMCTPTRAALMTGRYPFRYGLQTVVIPSGGTYGLAADEWLMPQMLKEAGYQTAIVGKWHLGHANKQWWPSQRGFDSSYGPLIGEIDHFKHTSHDVRDWYSNNELAEQDGYDTTLFADEAVRIIDGRDQGKPLFFYLALTAPHSPSQAGQKYLDMYPGIEDATRRAYAAQITAMDDAVGQVVAALDARGMRDNTLIVFSSDNGGTRSAKFAGEGAVNAEPPPDNGRFRDGKGSNYEGGTRVVAFANWPGHIKPSSVAGMLHMVDFFPTFAGLAGASLDKAKPLDGMDVWPTISTGAPSPRTEMVYNIEPFRAAIRQNDWKLVWSSMLPPRIELFDLSKDPSEQHNLADQHPETVSQLQERILDLAKQAAPPLFLIELVRLGLSVGPVFPGDDSASPNQD